MSEIVAETIGLRKVYNNGVFGRKTVAIHCLNLQIKRATITAIVGPNASGKTTTIHALLGFLRPTSGSIRLFGADGGGLETSGRVGYLPEDFRPYAFETPTAFLCHLGMLSGMKRSTLHQRIPETLAMLRLEDCKDRRSGTLSKGMSQRLGLAQALLHRPELLILDEPMSGLDPEARYDVARLIQDERAHGTTVILCTHDLKDVERLADLVYVYQSGRVIREGTVRDIVGEASGLEEAYVNLQRGRND